MGAAGAGGAGAGPEGTGAGQAAGGGAGTITGVGASLGRQWWCQQQPPAVRANAASIAVRRGVIRVLLLGVRGEGRRPSPARTGWGMQPGCRERVGARLRGSSRVPRGEAVPVAGDGPPGGA